MVLDKATITGPINLPDDTPFMLTVRIEAVADHGTVKAPGEGKVFAGFQTFTSAPNDDGDIVLTVPDLPLLPQTGVTPEDARWRATFTPLQYVTGGQPQPTPPASIEFEHTGASLWDDLIDVSGVSATQALLDLVNDARNLTLAARIAAETARTGAETARTGSEAARDEAIEYVDSAEEALAALIAANGSGMGWALDTDGVPYYDPDNLVGSPTLAWFLDNDGTPYYVSTGSLTNDSASIQEGYPRIGPPWRRRSPEPPAPSTRPRWACTSPRPRARRATGPPTTPQPSTPRSRPSSRLAAEPWPSTPPRRTDATGRSCSPSRSTASSPTRSRSASPVLVAPPPTATSPARPSTVARCSTCATTARTDCTPRRSTRAAPATSRSTTSRCSPAARTTSRSSRPRTPPSTSTTWAWSAIRPKSTTECVQDAFILGGLADTITNDAVSSFQGYGSTIHHNYFSNIARGVVLQVFCNNTVVHNNTFSLKCGNATGAAIEIRGDKADLSLRRYATGNRTYDNIIEVRNYKYGIAVYSAISTTLGPDGFYDPGTDTHKGAVYVDPSCSGIYVIEGKADGTYPLVIDPSRRASFKTISAGKLSIDRGTTLYTAGSPPNKTTNNQGAGPHVMSTTGEHSYVRSGLPTGGYAEAILTNINASTVADAVTTSGAVVADLRNGELHRQRAGNADSGPGPGDEHRASCASIPPPRSPSPTRRPRPPRVSPSPTARRLGHRHRPGGLRALPHLHQGQHPDCGHGYRCWHHRQRRECGGSRHGRRHEGHGHDRLDGHRDRDALGGDVRYRLHRQQGTARAHADERGRR